jgi:predicted membrane channel-forming protein YqfA (hemolysin III family)|tara:strand:- start:933 stop:1337 length:405 start_codon:yes stop_codon:yes gene_type:complete
MKIKSIFWICISLIFLQGLPLFISILSPEFKLNLVTEAFGSNPSEDALIIFNTFALVVGLLVIGIIFFIIGAMKFKELETLRRMSFLFFMLQGFFALPDLISVLKGEPTAPLPVIMMGLVTMGLFYYGSKKGTI